MKALSKADYYQTRWMNGSRLVDEDCLRDLYLPLIHPSAYALYQTLRFDASTLPASSLLLRLDLTSGEFTKALAPLEAVGLVRTFVEDYQGVHLFVFCLYPPKSVKEFFDDYLLQGTLHGMVGDDVFSSLSAKYKNLNETPDAEEVSTSFPKVFDQSYPKSYYLSGSALAKERGRAKERLSFDRGAFLSEIVAQGFRNDLFGDNEIDSIEKLATLYTVNEKLMAQFVAESLVFNAPVGKKVDMESLKAKCRAAMPFSYLKEKGESSNVGNGSVMAEKIRFMDSTPPSEYLRIRQGGHKPAQADLKLVERLSLQMGLTDPCINALIDYVLMTHDNTLSPNLVEKIAASLVREGCRSAKDAMDYLLRRRRKKTTAWKKPASKPVEAEKPAVSPADEEDEEVSEEEVKEMLAKLYNGKKS